MCYKTNKVLTNHTKRIKIVENCFYEEYNQIRIEIKG